MKKTEYSNSEIARKLGVSEGAIRYRIRREQLGVRDGRNKKPSMLDKYRGIIDQWVKDYEDSCRRSTMETLYEWLQDRYGYSGSYDAFRCYIRKHFIEFHRKWAKIKIETLPGHFYL